MILKGIFYFYFAQLHEMLCTNLIDFYRSLSRRKFIQREKRREEANFGPIWYFFLFSNQSLFSSPHLHTDFLVPSFGNWRLSRFTLSPLSSLSTIHGFRGQILDRERGGLVAFSRYLGRNCWRMGTRRACRTKKERKFGDDL